MEFRTVWLVLSTLILFLFFKHSCFENLCNFDTIYTRQSINCRHMNDIPRNVKNIISQLDIALAARTRSGWGCVPLTMSLPPSRDDSALRMFCWPKLQRFRSDFKILISSNISIVSLICDLQEDLTEEIWAKVTSSLVCTEIDNLVVNLNNNSVSRYFSSLI